MYLGGGAPLRMFQDPTLSLANSASVVADVMHGAANIMHGMANVLHVHYQFSPYFWIWIRPKSNHDYFLIFLKPSLMSKLNLKIETIALSHICKCKHFIAISF